MPRIAMAAPATDEDANSTRVDDLIQRGRSQGHLSLSDLRTAFEQAGAAIAPIYDTEQVVNDPHVQATGMVTTVEDEDLGPLKMQNLLFRLGASPGRIRFAGRGLGQDSDAVYAERLGLGEAQLARLRELGVI